MAIFVFAVVTFLFDNLREKRSVPLTKYLGIACFKNTYGRGEDGSELGGSRVHFPSTPVKHLADLRSRANSKQYSSIYEDQRPKIEDIERSDGKKSAEGQ